MPPGCVFVRPSKPKLKSYLNASEAVRNPRRCHAGRDNKMGGGHPPPPPMPPARTQASAALNGCILGSAWAWASATGLTHVNIPFGVR